jgi:hypothetical protein
VTLSSFTKFLAGNPSYIQLCPIRIPNLFNVSFKLINLSSKYSPFLLLKRLLSSRITLLKLTFHMQQLNSSVHHNLLKETEPRKINVCFQNEYQLREKAVAIPQEFHCTDAMLIDWKRPNFKHRHTYTRFAIHGRVCMNMGLPRLWLSL